MSDYLVIILVGNLGLSGAGWLVILFGAVGLSIEPWFREWEMLKKCHGGPFDWSEGLCFVSHFGSSLVASIASYSVGLAGRTVVLSIG
jgi:hypothetical protein